MHQAGPVWQFARIDDTYRPAQRFDVNAFFNFTEPVSKHVIDKFLYAAAHLIFFLVDL